MIIGEKDQISSDLFPFQSLRLTDCTQPGSGSCWEAPRAEVFTIRVHAEGGTQSREHARRGGEEREEGSDFWAMKKTAEGEIER